MQLAHFKYRAKTRDLPRGKMPNDLMDKLQRAFRVATSQALLAAALKVHVDSGMSVGQLAGIAIKHDLPSVFKILALAAARGAHPRWVNRRLHGKFADNSGHKTLEKGVKLGQKVKASKMKLGPRVFRFEMNFVVFQYYLWEAGLSATPGPRWGSDVAALIKFRQVWGELSKRVLTKKALREWVRRTK